MKLLKSLLFLCSLILALAMSQPSSAHFPNSKPIIVASNSSKNHSLNAEPIKKVAKKSASKKVAQNNKKATTKKTAASKTKVKNQIVTKLPEKKLQPTVATVPSLVPVHAQSVTPNQGGSSKMMMPHETKKPEEKVFSGEVMFTVGHDSNINPALKNKDTYFEIAPSLKAKSGGLSGDFSIKATDYSNTENSNLSKNSDFATNISYKFNFNPIFSSTTSIGGTYHDARTTNDLTGVNEFGSDPGMPERAAEAKFTQSVGIKIGAFNTSLGGFFTYHNSLAKETDGTDLEALDYERDYNEFGFKSKVTYTAAPYLDLSLVPTITQTKHDGVPARDPDGGKFPSIAQKTSVKEELVKSELGAEAAFKFLGSTVTPKASYGQIDDLVYGARDQEFYTVGLTSELVLHKASGLTLSPEFSFKRAIYDNWISSINPGSESTRVEYATTGGINAKIMANKYLALGLGYSISNLRSNLPDPLLNFKKELISTSVGITF